MRPAESGVEMSPCRMRCEPDRPGAVTLDHLDHWRRLEYKAKTVQVPPSNGPGEWQESDCEQRRASCRAKVVPAERAQNTPLPRQRSGRTTSRLRGLRQKACILLAPHQALRSDLSSLRRERCAVLPTIRPPRRPQRAHYRKRPQSPFPTIAARMPSCWRPPPTWKTSRSASA